MVWLTVGLVALIALGAIAYVVRPLWQPRRRLHDVDDTPLAELIARKDGVLLAIKELEFDYRTKKLSEADFQRDNTRLRHQAIALMKQIEKVAPQSSGMDAKLESLIAQQRRVSDPVTSNGDSSVLDDEAAPAENQSEPAVTPQFCTKCGAAAKPDDNFCGRCGTPLRQAAASQ